ncbi:hypothetical protein P7C73_g4945, partial [Tremellales sp. Uapishka_1]
MAPIRNVKNMLMELRKVCQHPYLSAPELEDMTLPEEEQQRQLVSSCGKLQFLKLLLPKLKERGHRVLLFSQFKIALDRIEDYLFGEGYKFLRLDGDVQQAKRQKSMDAFNAPGSDYFIFLLTTRAGGVGINLPAADTVIVYDPDFNPHMDDQAIARSHRYGQTRRVLVFRLMTKHSVEEQIILAGKKKKALGEVVVQQMGKDNEEGDIDSILLHGAKALYEKADENGVSASDIIYNSRTVDALIDGAEAEAAKAFNEKEKKKTAQNEDGTAEGAGSAEAAKKSTAFAFAKIWEADQNHLREVNDEEETIDDDMANIWQQVMEKTRLEKDAKLLEGARAKRNRTAVKYSIGPLSDGPPSAKKQKGKGKGKARDGDEEDSSSGDDYLQLSAHSDDDDEVSMGDPETVDLLNLTGNSKFSTLVAGDQGARMTKKQKRIMEAQAKMRIQAEAQRQAVAAVAGSGHQQSVPSVGGKSSREGETPEERFIRRTAKKARHAARALAKQNQAAQLPQAGVSSGVTTDHTLLATRVVSPTDRHLVSKITDDILSELRANGPLPPPAPSSRIVYSDAPSRPTNNSSQPANGHPHATNGGPHAITGHTHRMNGHPNHPNGHQNASNSRVARHYSSATLSHPQTAAQLAQLAEARDVLQWLYSALREYRHTKELQKWARMGLPEIPINTRKSHYVSLANMADMDLFPDRKTKYFTHRAQYELVWSLIDSGASILPEEPVRVPRVPEGMRAAPQVRQEDICPFFDHAHPGRICPEVLPLEDLLYFRDHILNSDEAETDKREGLEKLDAMIEHCRFWTRNAIAGPSKSAPAPVSTPRVKTVVAAPGSRDAAIVIDDDSGPEEAGDNLSTAPAQGSSHSRCMFCGSTSAHELLRCPVVTAGPVSIASALSRISPTLPIYGVLKKLYMEHLAVCAFCEASCGRLIRECAEANGGRKAFKGKIKMLEALRSGGDQSKELSKRIAKLYEVYGKWPNPLKAKKK